MDDKKHPTQSQSQPESQKDAGSVNRSPRPTAAKRVMAKRWIYPAIYLGAAAVIIGLMYVKSQMATSPTSVSPADAQPAATPSQAFTWPVASGTMPTVTMGFYPTQGTAAQQAAALVQFDHTFYPHQGLDIKASNGEPFKVTAAVSGTVTDVTSNPLNGGVVVVQSANGYVEWYESLSSTNVQKGDTVSAGQVIGTAGTCAFEQSQGNHLFFEVLQNQKPVDPATLLPKQ